MPAQGRGFRHHVLDQALELLHESDLLVTWLTAPHYVGPVQGEEISHHFRVGELA